MVLTGQVVFIYINQIRGSGRPIMIFLEYPFVTFKEGSKIAYVTYLPHLLRFQVKIFTL
jgi:hypothetical protein